MWSILKQNCGCLLAAFGPQATNTSTPWMIWLRFALSSCDRIRHPCLCLLLFPFPSPPKPRSRALSAEIGDPRRQATDSLMAMNVLCFALQWLTRDKLTYMGLKVSRRLDFHFCMIEHVLSTGYLNEVRSHGLSDHQQPRQAGLFAVSHTLQDENDLVLHMDIEMRISYHNPIHRCLLCHKNAQSR